MSKIHKIIDYIRHVREKGRTINKSGLYICFSLISIYALIMSIVCFIKLDTVMGIVNAIIGVFMILTIVIFSRIKSDRLLTGFVLSFLYTLMMFFLYEGGVGGISIMWLLFVPMGGMALINLYYGGILSLLIGVSTTLYMMTPLHSLGYQYSEEHRIRFPIIYWAFLILALFIFIRIDRAEEYQKKLVVKADESNRSKSEFLANMSHELRTPMNAIMGLCEINLGEEMNDTVRENNENIFHSSKDLMNIINDLLDFSKIGSGKMTLTCNEYHLSKVINDVINMIVARKGKKNIGFAVEVDPDIPDLLYGDEMRIKQIIINILTNALKYTQEGGFIMSVSHRKEAYGINLIITVKDSGIGIKKDQIGQIFDAYGRVDAEKTHKIEGTGLGLPITKKLVRLMNGVIGVKSEYGKGTEFRVVIPQKVIDETPFVTIGRNAGLGILYCCDMTMLHEFIARSVEETFHTIVKRYNFPGSIVDNAADVRDKIKKGLYSHIFVTKEEYVKDKEYFDELSEDIVKMLTPAIDTLADTICNAIVGANGASPAAVFLVGGGSLIEGLPKVIAEKLGIDESRVAIGGGDFLKNVDENGAVLGAEYVTPLGIAVTSILDEGYDFSVVTVNDKKVRVFDTKQLSVYEALTIAGYRSAEIMGRSGRNLIFTINGTRKTIKGEGMTPAQIQVNDKPASIMTKVTQGDRISIVPATSGINASAKLSDEISFGKGSGKVFFCGEEYTIGVKAYVNGKEQPADYDIRPLDSIETIGIVTIEDLLYDVGATFDTAEYKVNGTHVAEGYVLSDGDVISAYDSYGNPIGMEKPPEKPAPEAEEQAENTPEEEAPAENTEEAAEQAEKEEPSELGEIFGDLKEFTEELSFEEAKEEAPTEEAKAPEAVQENKPSSPVEKGISVVLNGDIIGLPNKSGGNMLFDLLNYIDIDTTRPNSELILEKNGTPAKFSTPIADGDRIVIRVQNRLD